MSAGVSMRAGARSSFTLGQQTQLVLRPQPVRETASHHRWRGTVHIHDGCTLSLSAVHDVKVLPDVCASGLNR